MIGKKIGTVGELRLAMSELSDDDIICIQTIDLETGDAEDLYPMNLDVIDGIDRGNGIVNEVRFCQMMNIEPDTRDKQPLVDALISMIEFDMADSDTTVLNELLKFLPYDILKHSLPEDVWVMFPNIDEKKSIWSEIRNDFKEGDIVNIDAWTTSDDNEGGTVIAKVNTLDQTVEYIDERARTDGYAQAMINELL